MDILRTARQQARRLVREPGFTAICVATLGLGIGVTTSMYSVVDAVLLEPLPYPEQDRLIGLWHTAPGLGFDEVNQSPALHYTYLEDGRVFEDVGMWSNGRSTITQLGAPEEVETMLVTHGTLNMLGAQPVRGRVFEAAEEEPGAPRTVILSYGYWQRAFGGDPAAVGKTLTVDGRLREIVGIMPADFRVLDHNADLLIPLVFDRTELFVGNFSYQGLARIKEGVTLEQVNADMARLVPVAIERYPGAITLTMAQEARFAPTVRPLAADVVGSIGEILWVLLGAVGIVLLIALGNVANLFVVRAEGRHRDVAVRAALGASRMRIAGEFLAESAVFALLGGVLGLGLTAAALRALRILQPDQLPRLQEIGIDGSVLLMLAGLTVLSAGLLALLPVLRYGQPRISSALREGGRNSSAGRERLRARSVLVVAQLALALILLAGSGLMIRSALALRSVDPGFRQPERLLTMRLAIPSAEVSDAEAVTAVHENLIRALEAVPGVASVGLTSSLPMSGNTSNDPVEFEDFQVPAGTLAPIRRYTHISPGYFETMGMRMIAGRDFSWDDLRNRPPIVVLSETLAREHYEDPAQAIGRRVRNTEGREWREIVGVVSDVHDDGLDQPATAVAYWPMLKNSLWGEGLEARWSMGYALRLNATPTPALYEAVQKAVWSVNPNLPLAGLQTLDRSVTESLARTTFTLIMLVLAASVALILGGVGLYGVISYSVTQRTREFGVRMALGARAGDVGRMVLTDAAKLIAIGVTVGIAGGLAATRAMQSILFGVAPFDPLTFAAVALLLAMIGLTAALVPVARAARVNPLESLRYE